MIKIDSFEELSSLLALGFKHHYQAHRFLFFIFQAPARKKSYSNIRFIEANSRLPFIFTELFHHNKPLCDSLQTEHIEALPGADAESIRSTLLVPFKQSDLCGLPVPGSVMQDQYSHGFKIDLLNYITMMSAVVIENIVSTIGVNQCRAHSS